MEETTRQHRWGTRDRAAAAVAVLMPVLFVFDVVRRCFQPVRGDFEVYWQIGRVMASGNPDVYAWVDGRSPWVFLYPPCFAALFAPISAIPIGVANVIWLLLQVPVLALSLLGLFRLLDVNTWRARAWLVAVVMVVLSVAFYRNNQWGQVNLFTLALSTWGLVFARRSMRAGAALALGLGVQTKVMPLALLPVLALQRRWRSALLALGATLVLCLAPVVWLIPKLGVVEGARQAVAMNVDYVSALALPRAASRNDEQLGGGWEGRNLAPSANLTRVNDLVGMPLPDKPLAWLAALFAFALYGLALLLARWFGRLTTGGKGRLTTGGGSDPGVDALAAGLGLMAALLAQLTLWSHHLVLLAIPLAAVVALDRKGRLPRWLLFVLCVLLVLSFDIPQSLRTGFRLTLSLWGVSSLGLVLAWGVMAYAGFTAKPESDPEPDDS